MSLGLIKVASSCSKKPPSLASSARARAELVFFSRGRETLSKFSVLSSCAGASVKGGVIGSVNPGVNRGSASPVFTVGWSRAGLPPSPGRIQGSGPDSLTFRKIANKLGMNGTTPRDLEGLGWRARAWQQRPDSGFSDLLSDRIGLRPSEQPRPPFFLPGPR